MANKTKRLWWWDDDGMKVMVITSSHGLLCWAWRMIEEGEGGDEVEIDDDGGLCRAGEEDEERTGVRCMCRGDGCVR